MEGFSLSIWEGASLIGTLLCLLGAIVTLSYSNIKLAEQQKKMREFAGIQNSVISYRANMAMRLDEQLRDNIEPRKMLDSMNDMLKAIVKSESKLVGSHYNGHATTHIEQAVNWLSKVFLVIGTILMILSLCQQLLS